MNTNSVATSVTAMKPTTVSINAYSIGEAMCGFRTSIWSLVSFLAFQIRDDGVRSFGEKRTGRHRRSNAGALSNISHCDVKEPLEDIRAVVPQSPNSACRSRRNGSDRTPNGISSPGRLPVESGNPQPRESSPIELADWVLIGWPLSFAR